MFPDIFPRYTIPMICLAINWAGDLIVLFEEYFPALIARLGHVMMWGGLLAFWVMFLAIAAL